MNRSITKSKSSSKPLPTGTSRQKQCPTPHRRKSQRRVIHTATQRSIITKQIVPKQPKQQQIEIKPSQSPISSSTSTSKTSSRSPIHHTIVQFSSSFNTPSNFTPTLINYQQHHSYQTNTFLNTSSPFSSSSSSTTHLTTSLPTAFPTFSSTRSLRTTASRLNSFYNNTSKLLPLSTTTLQSASMATKHEEVGVTPPTQEEDTIFGKITRGEIPVPKVYEDDQAIVINDLNPQAKVHMLVIPKKPISQLSKAEDDDSALLGHLFTVARKVAAERGLAESGYRLVVNNGKEGCQSVYHLHIHILGGEQLTGSFA